jgi:hypothetical protein
MHSRIARITCSRIKVTLKGIVCYGKTFDFETFEDTGSDLRRTVKKGGAGACMLHMRWGGGGEGAHADV